MKEFDVSEQPLPPAKSLKRGTMDEQPDALERDRALDQIRDALKGLEYGALSIIVQDGVIVQIERTERRRLRKNR